MLTVIDGLAALRPAARQAGRDAIVILGRHTYALMVEEVEDVIEAARRFSPQRAARRGWTGCAIGTVEAEGELYLLVDPHLLIAGPAARAA